MCVCVADSACVSERPSWFTFQHFDSHGLFARGAAPNGRKTEVKFGLENLAKGSLPNGLREGQGRVVDLVLVRDRKLRFFFGHRALVDRVDLLGDERQGEFLIIVANKKTSKRNSVCCGIRHRRSHKEKGVNVAK